jgi:mono/diheme cytochrome c family protein
MKRILKLLGVIVGAAVLLLCAVLVWLALRSPNLRPARTDKIESTPARLTRGEYLVKHVGDCLGCHSDHNDLLGFPVKPGTEGQGGFAFDETFGVPGVVCAQNLTPDSATGLGTWTDGELLRAIREGVSRDGHALFPMMPYQALRDLSNEDAYAIVVYLRTLKPIRHAVPPTRLSFPANLMIKFAPKPVAGPVVIPDDAKDHRAYSRYIVTIAGCQDCHTPHDDHGQPIAGREFSGGWAMNGPWGRNVSANITPHLNTFVGQASRELFIARFKGFAKMADPEEPRPAQPGMNTIMPWIAFSGMTEQDLGAIYDYLHTEVKPIANEVVRFPDAPTTK